MSLSMVPVWYVQLFFCDDFYIIDHKHCLQSKFKVELFLYQTAVYQTHKPYKLPLYRKEDCQKMKYVRKNPFLSACFPGTNHLLVCCVWLSCVIFVYHDWNGSAIVLWLGCVTCPVGSGLR